MNPPLVARRCYIDVTMDRNPAVHPSARFLEVQNVSQGPVLGKFKE